MSSPRAAKLAKSWPTVMRMHDVPVPSPPPEFPEHAAGLCRLHAALSPLVALAEKHWNIPVGDSTLAVELGVAVQAEFTLPAGTLTHGWLRRDGKKYPAHVDAKIKRTRLICKREALLKGRHPINVARNVASAPLGKWHGPLRRVRDPLPAYDIDDIAAFEKIYREQLDSMVATLCGQRGVCVSSEVGPIWRFKYTTLPVREGISDWATGPSTKYFEPGVSFRPETVAASLIATLAWSRPNPTTYARIESRAMPRHTLGAIPPGIVPLYQVPPDPLEEIVYPKESAILRRRLARGIDPDSAATMLESGERWW
jgi:hypothetical protein